MRESVFLAVLEAVADPSSALQTYINRTRAYIAAGGPLMNTSDEVWLEFVGRCQEAWDAVPLEERCRVLAALRS